MKYTIILLIFLLIPSAFADTSFFYQDDAFIMGNFASEPPSEPEPESGTTRITNEGGCTYVWNCTNWSECLPSGEQTRNCTNIGTCSGTYNMPEIKQNCAYTVPEFDESDNESEKEGEELKEETYNLSAKKLEGKEIIITNGSLINIKKLTEYLFNEEGEARVREEIAEKNQTKPLHPAIKTLKSILIYIYYMVNK